MTNEPCHFKNTEKSQLRGNTKKNQNLFSKPYYHFQWVGQEQLLFLLTQFDQFKVTVEN